MGTFALLSINDDDAHAPVQKHFRAQFGINGTKTLLEKFAVFSHIEFSIYIRSSFVIVLCLPGLSADHRHHSPNQIIPATPTHRKIDSNTKLNSASDSHVHYELNYF